MEKKVLVIEDEPVIAEMMSILLEMGGYKVISLGDTGMARRRLHEKEVGLVLLDLQLSGETGQSMCNYIKTTEDIKHLPVILVSANCDLPQISKDCGADDHIAKPFDLNFFMEKVKAHCLQDAVN
ncbi:response regulator transcription factor [Mucilaginibacter sp. UR6-11]|uniref:response regulator transcription factor n=1 Tax=Mucilaginibacter sp. UR6-11 TaxID=1435644 RepID=UPI001E5EFC03|nr:response regulator [Mucilaginibacter sp. UR6-11]MCC8425673.1 response regulator [Mucilaginibacter sp. UR6-11]